ncbi:alpha/beta fold hydrolase [bacterium]|nr:alpha/beta fold hydrolase [candidate division CSSED10-310 bacterium]
MSWLEAIAVWGVLLYLVIQVVTVVVPHVCRRLDRNRHPGSYPAPDPPLGKAVLSIVREIAVKSILLGAVLLSQPFRGRIHRSGQGPLVVVVHGYMGSWMNFMCIMRRLVKAGFSVIGVDLGFDSPDVATQADRLGKTLDAVEGPAATPVLCAHSMGGLVSRYFANNLARGRVRGIITLGTPHSGTRMSRFATPPARRDLAVNAEVQARLGSPADLGCPVLTIYSTFDQLVVPWTAARLPEPAEEFVVADLGHETLLVDSHCLDIIVNAARRFHRQDAAPHPAVSGFPGRSG